MNMKLWIQFLKNNLFKVFNSPVPFKICKVINSFKKKNKLLIMKKKKII